MPGSRPRRSTSPRPGYRTGRGYLVRPASAPPTGATTTGLPLVLVAHENRGLNPHIEDIARRLALENFIAFAPDALHPLGGYPGDEDKARELFRQLDPVRTLEDFVAAATYLKGVPGGNGKLGAVGFSGGGMVNLLATRLSELSAAVPFYGPAPPIDQVPKIKAAHDVRRAGRRHQRRLARVRRGAEGGRGALRRVHLSRTQHGFNNDTTPRDDAAAAKLAWQRTIASSTRSCAASTGRPSAAADVDISGSCGPCVCQRFRPVDVAVPFAALAGAADRLLGGAAGPAPAGVPGEQALDAGGGSAAPASDGPIEKMPAPLAEDQPQQQHEAGGDDDRGEEFLEHGSLLRRRTMPSHGSAGPVRAPWKRPPRIRSEWPPRASRRRPAA